MVRNKYLVPAYCIYAFFVLGIVSSLAIRLIILFRHINPDFIRPTWYAGVVGYIVFFAYRYYITSKRKSLILKHDLIRKINNIQEIDSGDRELLEYIVTSIVKSKEHINYMFIFISSIVAIIIDLVLEYLYPS